MAFHRLIMVKLTRRRRQGLNGNVEIHRTQSIGMKMIEKNAKTIQTDGINMAANAAARAALFDV